MTRRMNAHSADLVPHDADARSLMDQCRNRRWYLLQQFARLEIALKQRLENPPKTFGLKIRAWIKIDDTAKPFVPLIAARNLVAHASVQCVRAKSITYALWEVAEGTDDLNCAKFDKPALKVWADKLDDLLDQAVATATAERK